MRLLFVLLIIAVVFSAGYVMGVHARRQSGPKLSRPERKELAQLREFKSIVRSTAAQHSDVYPELSRIIADEVESTDRKLDEIRADA